MITPTIQDFREVLMDILDTRTKKELHDLSVGVELIPGPEEIKQCTRRAIKLLLDTWEEGE